MTLTRIVSGGQTGVDRGALDAALLANFPCGGWCPPHRLAEDGAIPSGYPLTEMDHGGYRERTVQNIEDSDATLVVYFDRLTGGTEQTVIHCIRRQKPYKLIDAEVLQPTAAAQLAARFVADNGIAVLNVAGTRASRWAGAHAFAFAVISELLDCHAGP